MHEASKRILSSLLRKIDSFESYINLVKTLIDTDSITSSDTEMPLFFCRIKSSLTILILNLTQYYSSDKKWKKKTKTKIAKI